MSTETEMHRIIKCWAMSERRAKHLCAYETLGMNARCRKPTKEEVKKAWQQLCVRLHPDKNANCGELATEAMACINLAKQHLFKEHFGEAAARVDYKHEANREEAQAKEAAEAAAAAEMAEAAEVAATAAAQARLNAEPQPQRESQQEGERPVVSQTDSTSNSTGSIMETGSSGTGRATLEGATPQKRQRVQYSEAEDALRAAEGETGAA